MSAIVIRRQGFAYAKASTLSRRLYELHPGNEVTIDEPDELSDFYTATIDDRAVYILKEDARRVSSVAEGASTSTPYVDIAAEHREGRRQSEQVPRSSSVPSQAHAARGLIGEHPPPQQSIAIPWRRVVTGLIGLGMVGLGLFLLSVGINPNCREPDPSGLCIGIAYILLFVGPILALLGTPVVLAAVRRPGSIPPLVVAGCITLLPGILFVFSVVVTVAFGDTDVDALGALVNFVVLVGMFTVAYLIAPREVNSRPD